MKKFVIGTVMLVSALLTFQPAVASAELTSSATETAITAPVAVLPVDSPTVTTEPAPVVAPEPEPVIVPAPEPVVAPAVVVPAPAPVTAPVESPVVIPAPTATATPTAVAPAPSAPAVAPVCHEDEPCWDCATMGNRICGREEGYHLAMAARGWDYQTVVNRFGALQPIEAEHREGYLYIPSITNPAYTYVYSLTTDEIAAGLSKK